MNLNKCYEETAIMIPKRLFPQERDWTCSIACLRSITSSPKNIGTECFIVENYNLKPGPHYSKDIKELNILKDFSVEFGCDLKKDYELDKQKYIEQKNLGQFGFQENIIKII